MSNANVLDAVLQSYANKPRVKQDVDLTVQIFKTLRAHEDTYVSNDGQSFLLISLSGIIPIVYKGASYNIPVQIWLLQDYPQTAPLAFVRPTQDMIIRQKHKNVDSSGQCYLPYLHTWNGARNNIMGLLNELQSVFSVEPPVHAKSKQPPPVTFKPGGASVGGSLPSLHGTPNFAYTTYPPPARPLVHPASSNKDRLNVILREKAAIALQTTQTDVNQFQLVQQRLLDGSNRIRQSLDKLRIEKKELEEKLLTLMQRDEELNKWLLEHEGVEVPIDEKFIPADPLSQQLFDLVATDTTIEDTVYELDKALYAGTIDVDTHIKMVRKLCAEQFHTRALAQKVFAIQTQTYHC